MGSPHLTDEQRMKAVRLYWSSFTAGEIAGMIDMQMQTVYWLWWKARKRGKLPKTTRPIGGF